MMRVSDGEREAGLNIAYKDGWMSGENVSVSVCDGRTRRKMGRDSVSPGERKNNQRAARQARVRSRRD